MLGSNLSHVTTSDRFVRKGTPISLLTTTILFYLFNFFFLKLCAPFFLNIVILCANTFAKQNSQVF